MVRKADSQSCKQTSLAAPRPLQQLVLVLALLSACALHSSSAKADNPSPTFDQSRPSCARECFEASCDTIGLRYGKYCGVGHGGCPGEEPCDEADACCKLHDECVGEKHMLDSDCHADFLACLDQVMLAGSKGFSKQCPYSLVIPTMKNGIEMTMMFGDLFKNVGDNMEIQLASSGNAAAGSKFKKRRTTKRKAQQ